VIELFDFSQLAMRDNANLEAFFEWRRRAFPFFARKTFLTHASVSPLPAHARDALHQYAEHICNEGQFDYGHDAIYKRCKERIAQLLKENAVAATPHEIAFASSTSHALGLVATSLPWIAGENCIVADGDFPANVTTWKNLEHTHGIEVRMVPFRARMDISLEDIMPLVDEKTRIVSLASCNFLSGFPPNLKEIGNWLHARGVLLCVDAIQTLGAVRCDFSEVDFICADAHKWLLGPNGIALLWTRKEVLQTLRPAIFGWLAAQDRANWFAYDTTPIACAERFEPGARNYLGIVGMEASLEVLQSHDAALIENRIVKLRNFAAQLLQEHGFEVLWSPTSELKSGIVSFRAASDTATTALYRKLDEKFALSLRADKNGNQWIRVSAHFMNCEQDIEDLVQRAKLV
jgi:selenocysteine lyase/cysteine desulfurase